MIDKLHQAVGANNTEKVSAILTNANPTILNSTSTDGQSSLHTAVKQGSFDIALMLVTQNEIDINLRETVNGDTPLHSMSFPSFPPLHLTASLRTPVTAFFQLAFTPFHEFPVGTFNCISEQSCNKILRVLG